MDNNKDSAYIVLGTGKKFYPYNPSRTALAIEDIVPALANVCRFSGQLAWDGQTNNYYSLLQHSLLVHQLCMNMSPEHRLAALFHDAEEVLGFPDVPTPVKNFQEQYKKDGEVVQEYVAAQFGYTMQHLCDIKFADSLALSLEAVTYMDMSQAEEFNASCVTHAATAGQKGRRGLIDTILHTSDKTMLMDWFIEAYMATDFQRTFKKMGVA